MRTAAGSIHMAVIMIRKHGGYHCHQGSLAGQSFASKQAMLDALEAGHQPPKDLTIKV